MDYIAVGLFAFFLGMITMSMFAANGAQAAMVENDALHEVNRNLCARLDGRTVTLHDEDGMAVEMPVEHRMEEVA